MLQLPRNSSSSDSTEEEEWDTLHSYALSLSQQAYMVSSATLTTGEHLGAERLTEMRLREMIVDNVQAAVAAAAGSNDTTNGTTTTGTGRILPPKIRWIGFRQVTHEGAAESIRAVFEQTGIDVLDRSTIEVAPAYGARFSACFDGNPLARSVRSLTRNHDHAAEMVGMGGGAFEIRRFVFIAEGNEFGKPRLHILVELGSPATLEEGLEGPLGCGGVVSPPE